MSLKIVIRIYTAAVALASLAIATLSVLFQSILRHKFWDFGGTEALAPATSFFVSQQWWVLFVIVPCFIAAIKLTIGRTVTTEKAFLFAGCSTLVIVALFTLAIIALVPPFMPNLQHFEG